MNHFATSRFSSVEWELVDAANYFDRIFDKRPRVEHWDNAVSQGQHWASIIVVIGRAETPSTRM